MSEADAALPKEHGMLRIARKARLFSPKKSMDDHPLPPHCPSCRPKAADAPRFPSDSKTPAATIYVLCILPLAPLQIKDQHTSVIKTSGGGRGATFGATFGDLRRPRAPLDLRPDR